MLVPIILSGGDGTRLWPASRKSLPKQFVYLVDQKKSLLQMAIERINSLKVDHSGIFIISNEEHRFLVAEQTLQMNAKLEKIILEPVGRNTAPAITIAAIEALKKFPSAKLLIQTSDHIIPDLDYFSKQIEKALATDHPIITFGVKPTRPEIGFGYIKVGNQINNSSLYRVEKFIEKPDLKRAEKIFKTNSYLWNSGMFLIDAEKFLNEIKKFEPQIYSSCEKALEKSVNDLDFTRIDKASFQKSPKKSIDYAIIERSREIAVLPYYSFWKDLGSWDSIFEYLPKDKNENLVIGDCILNNSFNTMVRSENRLVCTLGVNDLIIIETSDVVLVTKNNEAEKVKNLVDDLKKQNRIEAIDHNTGYRPWGTYRSLCKGKNFQVKLIEVKPKKSLSLQLHRYRAEHWIIVEGVAEITNGNKKFILKENQSTFIPIGTKHRLTNPSDNHLKIIEVQSGSYFGEDDIIRFDDNFGRI